MGRGKELVLGWDFYADYHRCVFAIYHLGVLDASFPAHYAFGSVGCVGG